MLTTEKKDPSAEKQGCNEYEGFKVSCYAPVMLTVHSGGWPAYQYRPLVASSQVNAT